MGIPGQLLDHISSGNCVLFVGAGASIEAGAPSSKQLAAELSHNFLNDIHNDEPLPKVSSYIEAMPGLGRRVLSDFLYKRLSELKPTSAHLLIPKFNWASIYTTNYDTLIEKSYESSPNYSKCMPIISSRDIIFTSPSKTPTTYLYKPHGCVSRLSSSESPLIITEDDYNISFLNREYIYKQLEIFKYKSVFLFVGYSFSDFDISKIWFEISNELSELNNWSYALLPGCTEVQRLTWRKRNVELIDLKFSDFMIELSSSLDHYKKPDFYLANSNYNDILKLLMTIMEKRNLSLRNHCIRVQRLSEAISLEMALNEHEIMIISIAALVHDIGYLGIDDAIINKKEPLTKAEMHIIMTHSVIGEDIVSSISYFKPVADIIRSVHESYNGKGYPDGLSKENIPIGSRIIAAAEALDAIINDQPYRKKYSIEEAINILSNSSGKQFDPTVINAITQLQHKGILTHLFNNRD